MSMISHFGGTLYISVTRQCNIDCSYCHLDADIRNSKSKQDINSFIALMDSLYKKMILEKIFYKQIVFIGAEPTVMPAKVLAESISKILEVCAYVTVQTNGVNIGKSEYATEFFSSINKSLYKRITFGISLDGNAEIHNKTRDNSYADVMKGVNVLKMYGIKIGIQVTITKTTIEHIDKFVHWAKVARILYNDNLKFRLVEGAENILSSSELRVYTRAVYDNGLEKFVQSFMQEDSSIAGNKCNILEIEPSGEAFPCNQDREVTKSIGNIFSEEMLEIIKKRDSYFLSDKFLLTDECSSCSKLHECNGGCPIYRVNGKANDCFIKKNSISKKIKVNDNKYYANNSYINSLLIQYSIKLFMSQKTVWSVNGTTANFSLPRVNNGVLCFSCISCIGCVSCVSCVSCVDVGNIVNNVVDTVSDVVSDVSDTVSDVVSDVTTPVWEDVLKPALDFGVDITADFVNLNLDVIDWTVQTATGTEDFMQGVRDFNEGLRFLQHASLNGNTQAMMYLVVVAAAVAITVLSAGSAGVTAGAVTATAFDLGVTSVTALNTIYYTSLIITYSSAIYSLYGVSISVSELGKILKEGGDIGSILKYAGRLRDSMNLSFVNGFINGSMNLWMAGGALYDAPRAGDILFNVAGNLNTVRFLGLQDQNYTPDMQVAFANPEQYKMFGKQAGDDFFSIM